jgi:hypothetical protein
MNQITVTVRNHTGDFRKTTDVPADMTFGDFKLAAQERAGMSQVPCNLILEKTNKVMRDSDTFEEAGIEPGSVFILVPEAEAAKS